MRSLGRWVNLNDGREVNLHRDRRGCTFYLSRGRHVAVYDSDRFGSNAVWFELNQPRRKKLDGVFIYPDGLFYSKEWRSWTLRWTDEVGNQVGEAVYAANKTDLYRVIRAETVPYELTDELTDELIDEGK